MITNRFLKVATLCSSIIVILACNLGNSPTKESPDPSLAETEVQLRVQATSIAIQQMTLEAAQAQMTGQSNAQPPTQPAPPTSTSVPTQAIQPSPVPNPTNSPIPASLVLGIQTSVDTFYCYQSPYELTITVRVSDINRGMAVYYHIEDKVTRATSDGQVLDLHRSGNDTRSVTIIGGGSMDQNLQFPPLMGESYFIYQIISDDGTYRSPAYSDVTFFPCGQ